MKAIVIRKPGEITIEEREIPTITNGQVLIKVKAAGVCGSDIHIFHGKNAFATYPRVVGHEFTGEIVDVGKNVTNLSKGMHVVVDPVIACGKCAPCLSGHPNVCRSLKVLGVHQDGGYQEYVAVNAEQVYPISNALPWKVAATVEPFSIGAQVAHRGRLSANDTVLICGAGPIGLIILQVAKMIGAQVAIMDIVENRLKKAKSMGADFIIHGKEKDFVKELMTFTNGDGATLIYEATGNIKILSRCIREAVSPAGRIVVLGFTTEEFPMRQVDIMSRELEIIGTRLNNRRFPEVITWFKNDKVRPLEIITNVFPAEKAEEAFTIGAKHPESVLKVILSFE